MLQRWILLQQLFDRSASFSMRHRQVRDLNPGWIGQELLVIYKMKIAAHEFVSAIKIGETGSVSLKKQSRLVLRLRPNTKKRAFGPEHPC
ncbi:hypothetical protein [Microvirga yunnanensis]|uniref:hypothetical protein n=1 Tax=Microvirga yunnanensis TaxID=2953740 RepID=UPI0021C7636A|nr:hypothetical protein [Microvirga sp. HBU65207]